MFLNQLKGYLKNLLYVYQFNFVGRLLGPRGNSLKRVEATTGCRVYIRGKGSIKDPDKVLCYFILFFVGMKQIHLAKKFLTLPTLLNLIYFILDISKEEKLRGRPGYEHLNEPLHILIEADLPANIVDIRLRQAQEIIEELLKPVVDFYSCPQIIIQILLSLFLQNIVIFQRKEK